MLDSFQHFLLPLPTGKQQQTIKSSSYKRTPIRTRLSHFNLAFHILSVFFDSLSFGIDNYLLMASVAAPPLHSGYSGQVLL